MFIWAILDKKTAYIGFKKSFKKLRKDKEDNKKSNIFRTLKFYAKANFVSIKTSPEFYAQIQILMPFSFRRLCNIWQDMEFCHGISNFLNFTANTETSIIILQ